MVGPFCAASRKGNPLHTSITSISYGLRNWRRRGRIGVVVGFSDETLTREIKGDLKN
jgi:hypothetical protein